jgi:putative addiction module component (TIGR02574 family)
MLTTIATIYQHGDNLGMSMSQNQFFETALSLPQSERADLAFQLLQSLEPPGDEVADEEFGGVLRGRLEAYRRGELESSSLEETREIIRQRLANGPSQ